MVIRAIADSQRFYRARGASPATIETDFPPAAAARRASIAVGQLFRLWKTSASRY